MFPSSETCDAPLASRANLGPLSCFAVSFTAPRILAAALVGLEIDDFDSMRWPDVVVSAQIKRVARDVTVDIRKKVFVGRDAKSRETRFAIRFQMLRRRRSR